MSRTEVRPQSLEGHLRARRDAGRKLLAPYLVAGQREDWLEVLQAVVAAGADAVEVGFPFSDPVMDGPTIQEAAERSLARGTTPATILSDLRQVVLPVPLVAMTYFNLVFRMGPERFAAEARAAGLNGVILPDVPMEELGEWEPAAATAGVETVLLASPISSDERLDALCARSQGFVYGVNLLGVTGERVDVGGRAAGLARRLRARTDLPVLLGFGVSDGEQARALCEEADGVIVGSALVRRVTDGASPDEVGAFVAELRQALDG